MAKRKSYRPIPLPSEQTMSEPEIVDWPTSPGFWWMNYDFGASLAYATNFADAGGLSLLEVGVQFRTDKATAKTRFPGARFVKLQEQNPFPAH